MKRAIIIFLVLATAALAYTDRDRIAAYESVNGLTSTPYMSTWDGDTLVWITLPGVTVADIQAVTDAQVDAYRAGAYPDPAVIVPGLTTNGTPDGKTYRLAVVDGELIVATNSASPQRQWSIQSAEFVQRALAAKANRAAVTYAARTMIRSDDLTTNEVQELVSMLPPWAATGTDYAIGAVVSYDGKVWECVQAHTSQAVWTPSAAPSLWKARSPSDSVILPWVQPTGAHDAYAVDAIVTYGGKTWRNTLAANVYAPGVFGWVEVP